MLRFPARLGGYFLTAGTAAVVDVGGFTLLEAQGMPILAAATLSFLVAVVVNYLLSSRFVFGAAISASGFALFASAALFGLAINVGVTWLAAVHLGLAPALAKIAGVGTAFLINFAVNSRLVFRKAEDRSSR